MKFKFFILMYIDFFIFSCSNICLKIASRYPMLSWQYILCFGGVIGILGLYAIIWQQVLRHIQLSVAMAHRPVVMLFTTMLAVLLFGERVNVWFFIGMAFIVAGLLVIGVQNE